MVIRNITIENFQSYYSNNNRLDFDKGLNLVIGNGGKGKSKLFNAFYWVLFGKIYITGEGWCSTNGLPGSSHMSLRRHEFFNMRALYEAKVGETVRTSVQMELEDDKGFLYQIERSATAERTEVEPWDSDKAWIVANNVLKISFDSLNGTVVKNDDLAEDVIRELFPEGIRDYIWFQGESLDSLIDFRKKDDLKAAVKHISYYPYYEKLADIITVSQKRIATLEMKHIREANKHNDTVNELTSAIDLLRYKLDQETKNKEKIATDISLVQIALNEDQKKMSGLAGYAGLLNKFKNCQSELECIGLKLTELDNYQRSKLPTLWILRGIDKLVDESKRLIASHIESECTAPERKYLDNPSRAKLQEILKDQKCFVCGSDVLPESAQYHWIMERLKEQEDYLKELDEYKNNLEESKQFNMLIGRIQDYPDALLVSLASIDKQYKDSEEEIDKLLVKRRKLIAVRDELEGQIDDLKKKYGIDVVRSAETAGILDNNIKVSQRSLESLQRKYQTSEQTISSLKTQLNAKEKELTSLGKGSGSVTTVEETEWKNISTFLEDICKRVREKARKELLHKIEERANIFYAKFTEHDNGYKGQVEIDDDYSIKFDAGLNTSHEDRKKMSIINALLSLNQEAMGIFYPFISDAPTSSFDVQTTHKYLLGIKDIFEQSIIMTKDVEIGSENYQDLFNQDKISKIYYLNSLLFDSINKEPKIYEVATSIERKK